jgi:hypothetical protein
MQTYQNTNLGINREDISHQIMLHDIFQEKCNYVIAYKKRVNILTCHFMPVSSTIPIFNESFINTSNNSAFRITRFPIFSLPPVVQTTLPSYNLSNKLTFTFLPTFRIDFKYTSKRFDSASQQQYITMAY